MNRFTGVLLALGIAFIAGWLMGADFPPPHTKDVAIGGAFWLFLAVAGIVLGLIFAPRGGRDRYRR